MKRNTNRIPLHNPILAWKAIRGLVCTFWTNMAPVPSVRKKSGRCFNANRQHNIQVTSLVSVFVMNFALHEAIPYCQGTGFGPISNTKFTSMRPYDVEPRWWISYLIGSWPKMAFNVEMNPYQEASIAATRQMRIELRALAVSTTRLRLQVLGRISTLSSITTHNINESCSGIAASSASKMSSATADSDVMLALIRARCWLCRKSIDIDSLLASKNRTFPRACGNIQPRINWLDVVLSILDACVSTVSWEQIGERYFWQARASA